MRVARALRLAAPRLAASRLAASRLAASRSFSSAAAVLHPLAAYGRSGYAVPSARLSEIELQRARRAVGTILERNAHLQPEQLVNAHLEQPDDAPADVVRGSPDLLRLACLPMLSEIAARCLGTDDVIVWACQLFAKPAREGRAVPWHQDGVYWPIQPMRACTIWVAVDESIKANGGLRVIPDTHTQALKHSVIGHDVYGDTAIRVAIPPETLGPERLARATHIELEPGMLSVHDAMLVHGSEANQSGSRRAGLAVSFMAAASTFQRDVRTMADREGGLKLDFSRRPLILVRGHNRHPGNTNFMQAPGVTQEAASGSSA